MQVRQSIRGAQRGAVAALPVVRVPRPTRLARRPLPAVAAAAAAASRLNVAGQDVGPKDAPLPSLFPEVPKLAPGAPKLRVAIVGGGLAGLSTAVELLDQGYEVDIYEGRQWVGGKVASFQDKDGNHIEMGLHVFFGCYFNLFRLMAKCGVLENLLVKDHTHTFCNLDGDVRELDFRFFVGDTKIGAPFHGLKAFFTTPQLEPADKLANSLALGTSPIVRALFDPEGGMRDIRALDNISFTDWFKSHGGSDASIKRMWDPIAYALGFLDCNDISARCMLTIFQFFATKTDASVLRMLSGSPADRLLKPITDYVEAKGGRIHLRSGCNCFADLALTSPAEYFRKGEGSLMQCVITPAAPYMAWTNEAIAAETDRQVRTLFPSARGLKLQWHSIVKIGQSLYREAPGVDPYRPDQVTPIPNFFLAGSYTKQDYIDSMEGATLSGRQCAYSILKAAPAIARAAAAERKQRQEAVAA
ncbi:zeta-carotene desaturase [Raphidocelis subcapitata]|uniref:Zeta-carotene desaturase n=1 Tax=Raphidocelis subcapitata TaxID=307507 RepID=A0A2V0NLA3_9CHLO|nr:zeta-carotene desaturase [Raphidocelis subcapitata]|eukprot:GBF88171.1 zeta-carotene desaturase [Raphidocelis subcapitata]